MLRIPAMIFAFSVAACRTAVAYADTLEDYAKKCDAAVGVTVPDFDCDAGTAVPETHLTGTYPTAKCDRPNVLNHECDAGSRFQVLVNTAQAFVVAHCRKKTDVDDGKYGDIAVIQYSRTNGATCFYQSHVDNPRWEGGTLKHSVRLDPKVQAPSKGTSAWSWHSPAEAAGMHCGECHDNGPFIRSPYLAQLKDVPGAKDVLPGSHDSSFNSNQPYAFVGDDFKTWKAYSVEVAGNTCNTCHRMGVNDPGMRNIDVDAAVPGSGGGTSRVFGIIATSPSQTHKNPHGADSPIWMTPGDITFQQGNLDAANGIRTCALAFGARQTLPANCKVTLFAKAYPGP